MRRRALIIAILLLAFALRVNDLRSSPLWFDESMEYWIASAPLDQLLPSIKSGIQDPPLYSVALHFWKAIGDGEFILRYLSLSASLLSIAGIYLLGKKVHSEAAGMFAALLLTFIPPDIRFAQEVGQYAFLTFSLVFYFLILILAIETNAWRYWIAWSLMAVIGIYSYYGSLLLIVPVALVSVALSVIGKRWQNALRQGIAILIFIVASLPLLTSWLPDQLFRGPTTSAFTVYGLPIVTEIELFLQQTADMLSYQLTGYLPEPTLWTSLKTTAWLLVLLVLLVVLRAKTKHRQVILWLVLSWGLYYLAGRFGAYPYGGTRHALILTPLLVLALAISTATLWYWRRFAGLAILAAMLVTTILAPGEAPEDLRSVASQWLNRRDPTTPTYVYYGAVPGFRYQVERLEKPEEDVYGIWFRECWFGEQPDFCSDKDIHYGRWIRQLTPSEKVEEITDTFTEPVDRFWLILSHTSDTERVELIEAASDYYRIADFIEASGASAYLFDK